MMVGRSDRDKYAVEGSRKAAVRLEETGEVSRLPKERRLDSPVTSDIFALAKFLPEQPEPVTEKTSAEFFEEVAQAEEERAEAEKAVKEVFAEKETAAAVQGVEAETPEHLTNVRESVDYLLSWPLSTMENPEIRAQLLRLAPFVRLAAAWDTTEDNKD